LDFLRRSVVKKISAEESLKPLKLSRPFDGAGKRDKKRKPGEPHARTFVIAERHVPRFIEGSPASFLLYLKLLRSATCLARKQNEQSSFALLACTASKICFANATCLPRKWECKHSHFARLRCVDKPDSVEGGHLSGMNVAIHLKRFFPRFLEFQEKAGHDLA